MKQSSRKRKVAKRVLRLPDLDFAKTAVLNTLGSPSPSVPMSLPSMIS
jgi:hypothetical protein